MGFAGNSRELKRLAEQGEWSETHLCWQSPSINPFDRIGSSIAGNSVLIALSHTTSTRKKSGRKIPMIFDEWAEIALSWRAGSGPVLTFDPHN